MNISFTHSLITGRSLKFAIYLLPFVIAVSVVPGLHAADVERWEHDGTCVVSIKGDIDKQTVTRVKSLLNTQYIKRNCPHINGDVVPRVSAIFESNGGDVLAAIQIGELLRKLEANTFVLEGRCASACVVSFVGGVTRNVSNDGIIGLHRPYSMQYSMSNVESRMSYKQINQKLQIYFRKLNISERLLEEMNAVSPYEMRWLSAKDSFSELQSLTIVGDDPIWQDKVASVSAQMHGITKKEYYLRQQKTIDLCLKKYFGSTARTAQSQEEARKKLELFDKCKADVWQGRI